MKSYKETNDGKFKIGDEVKTTELGQSIGLKDERFKVGDIVCDSFGCVLLKEPGGYGYGEQYCEHVDS